MAGEMLRELLLCGLFLILVAFSDTMASSISSSISRRRMNFVKTPQVEEGKDRMNIGTIEVSSIGIGTLGWSAIARKESIGNLVELAQEKGCDFFDTAERYGASKEKEAFGGDWGGAERLLSVCSQSSLRPIKVATKFTPSPFRMDAQSVVEACEASRKRLGVESIDLYQIHMPDIIQPFMTPWKIRNVKDELYWEGLIECYKRGIVKNVGVSNYGKTLLLRAHEKLSRVNVPLAANQINYSLLYRTKAGAQDTVDIGKEMGVQTLGSMPLAMGLLTDKCQSKRKRSLFEKRNFLSYANEIQPLLDKMEKMGQNKGKTVAQIALNYVISKGVLPLAGSNSRSQLEDNMGARGWRLSRREIAELDLLSDQTCALRSFEGAGLKRSNEKFVGYGFVHWNLD